MSNGLHIDKNGDLLIAQDSGGDGRGGARAIARRNLATGAMTLVADRYQGKRYDCGSREGFLQANIELALEHPEFGPGVRDFLERMKQ